MKLQRCLSFMALCVWLVVSSGCGNDDNKSSATPPDSPAAKTGQQLYAQACQECHTAAALSFVTTTLIKEKSMTFGLNDAELVKLVAYLAPTTPPDQGGSDIDAGKALYNSKCLSCHANPSLLSSATLDLITSKKMTYGLSDTELQKVVTYLSSLK